MQTGYVRRWPPLLDGIHHIQRVRNVGLEEAWRELLAALYEGEVRSRRPGAGDNLIDPERWASATGVLEGDRAAVVFESVSDKGQLAIADPSNPYYVPRWQVEICRVDLLRVWPEPAARSGTLAAENRCQAWLVGLMRDGGPKKARREYEAEGNQKFDIGSRAFSRAWANAIVESGNAAWRKPGRKSRQRIDTAT